ncbi:DUF3060 domain-containing protein [bacterium]|nr:DUF3060 domain-containing protein [bacterium]
MDKLTMEKGQVLRANASECALRLEGPFRHLLLRGQENHVQLLDRVEVLEIEGTDNSIECRQMPGRIRLRGQGNSLLIEEHPGEARPPVDVRGNNQAVKFRRPKS